MAAQAAGDAFLSFGAGAHHGPGRHVALYEARPFLDALLRVPGIRLERAPDIGWSDLLMSDELRGAIVTCDPAGGATAHAPAEARGGRGR